MSSYPQERFRQVRFSPHNFWGKKRTQISSVAVLYQLDTLKKTGRYEAFRLKWKPIYEEERDVWPAPPHLFWDSDVAKWIEGACYFLHEQENQTVRNALNELVGMIASAQQPDGYLNVHFTLVKPGERFSNLRDLHELYNCGHLIEAALAHEQLYGNRNLLNPIVRYVDLLAAVFGPHDGQKPGYPGHPEIELALLRLYSRTGDSKHLNLAQFFLTERGNPKGIKGKHYYDWEAEKRGEGPHEVPDCYPVKRSYWYQQAQAPLLEQKTIEGHSVRAMYLLTAVADLARIRGNDLDKGYRDTLHRLWANMVQKKMYLTGGIGAVKQWEGFGPDYQLPQGTDEGGCYAETCASIGVIMLAERLLEMERNGHYGDILELELYNAVLTGVSCDGKSWTYVNQLASSDRDPSARSKWFTVACCPPNVLRLLGDLGGYMFSSNVDESKLELTIHLYADATIVQQMGEYEVKVMMRTDWPLDGNVSFEIECPSLTDLCLHVRIPEWAAQEWTLRPQISLLEPVCGYLRLDAGFMRQNPRFDLNLPMRPRLVSPHPLTGQNLVSVQRGPLVYCVEDVDNEWCDDHFKSTVFHPKEASLKEKRREDGSTGEDLVYIIAEKAASQMRLDQLLGQGPGYSAAAVLHLANREPLHDLHFVPYYFRANRGGHGHMRVGLRTA